MFCFIIGCAKASPGRLLASCHRTQHATMPKLRLCCVCALRKEKHAFTSLYVSTLSRSLSLSLSLALVRSLSPDLCCCVLSLYYNIDRFVLLCLSISPDLLCVFIILLLPLLLLLASSHGRPLRRFKLVQENGGR